MDFSINSDKNKDLKHISDIAYSFWKSRTLFTGCELDVFTLIGEGAKSAEQLNEELKIEPRGLNRLLNALVALKLLKKEHGLYSNTDNGLRFLSRNSPDFANHLMHLANQWDLWSHLTDSVKQGAPKFYQDFGEKDEPWMSHTASAMHWKATLEADAIVDSIDMRKVKNVLDLGGSTGYYSYRLLQKYPDLNITLYDHPRLRKYAIEFLESVNMLDRVRLISGCFFEKEFGEEKEYDLVLASHLLNEFSIWENIELLSKIYHFISLNGHLIVNERIINDDRVGPVEDAMQSLDLLVNTKKGEIYTETDIWVMMRESMFINIEKVKNKWNVPMMIGYK